MIGLAAPVELVDPAKISLVTGPRVVFWVIAASVLGGAILTITRRNAVASVMALVATFFGLAACYALLSAHFLAAVQVLVYAGAIMVLFIFVVMVLNRDEVDPWTTRLLVTEMIGAWVIAYLAGRLIWVMRGVSLADRPPPAGFGTVEAVGLALFQDDLFAFEAISLLLLIAVVAAVVLARTHRAGAALEPNGPPPPGGHA
jgi:NADH-quinone oxidoreductase subunit J